MSDEWKRHREILGWEDKEFREVMEKDVCALLSSEFQQKDVKFWAGIGIIAQIQTDFLIVKQYLALFS